MRGPFLKARGLAKVALKTMRRRHAHLIAPSLLRKIDNFLPSRPECAIVFQKADRRAARPETSALGAANDSGMAPQAIGIAQNGLGNGAGSRSAQKENQANPAFQRGGDEVGEMEDKLGSLDAAREALREAESGPLRLPENAAKRNRPQALDNKENREMTDSAPPMISEA
jgi:hypothetical protein